MKARHWIEAAIAGALLTAAYFFALRHFGIRFGGGYATLALTVPALAWLYALARFARRDAAGEWVWFGHRYHPYALYQVLWPGAFGAVAFLALITYLKEPRAAFFAGWLFPAAGAATFWSLWHDRRQHRA